VSFPVDMLHLSQDGDVCKSRNTVASHVEEMMGTFTERLLSDPSEKMLDGPVLAAVLVTSAPHPSYTEEVLQELCALGESTRTLLNDPLLTLKDEEELLNRIKNFINDHGELVVIGCTHLTTALQRIHSELMNSSVKGFEYGPTIARKIRCVEVKVLVHVTPTEASAEGTAHNLRQHNVLKPSMHDVFRGVVKHFLNAREMGQIGRQGTGVVCHKERTDIISAVFGTLMSRSSADTKTYIWKAGTWCERMDFYLEMSKLMDALDHKKKQLSKSFFIALILNMDTEKGKDFIVTTLEEVLSVVLVNIVGVIVYFEREDAIILFALLSHYYALWVGISMIINIVIVIIII